MQIMSSGQFSNEEINQAHNDLWNYGFSEPLVKPNFSDQCDPEDIKEDMESWLRRHGIEDVFDLIRIRSAIDRHYIKKFFGNSDNTDESLP